MLSCGVDFSDQSADIRLEPDVLQNAPGLIRPSSFK